MSELSEPVRSETVNAAEDAMRLALDPAVFNHTLRVLHLAEHLSAEEPIPDREALAVAVLFHDSGTAPENNGEQRFEVEGADAAARFLEQWSWPSERSRPVWEAIALHTSAGIAERFGPLARLVRTAVLVDLGRIELSVRSTPELETTLAGLPRLDVDRVLPEAVVLQALEPGRSAKAPPFSWPGALVAEHLAGRPLSTRPTLGTHGDLEPDGRRDGRPGQDAGRRTA
jgi:hypothetical protein